MSLSLIVVTLGAVVAVVGAGVLLSRFARASRAPDAFRASVAAWAVAAFGLAVALSCQVIGDLAGYDGLMFRAMELGAQLVAPLALCLGLAQLVGKSVPARFAMWLAVSAVAVVAFVILGTDPLSQNVTFSTRWPDPTDYYQLAPKAVLEVLAPFTFLTAVVATFVTTLRSRRDSVAVTEVRPVVSASSAAALLAVPGLVMLGGSAIAGNMPLSGRSMFALVCTGAAGLTWFAGLAAARLERAGARAGTRDAGQDDWLDEDDRRDDESYRVGEFDRFDPAGRADRYPDEGPGDRDGPGGPGAGHRGATYRDDLDPDWSETAGRRADDAGGPVRYPGLAALASESGGSLASPGRPGEAGELDEAGRLGESDRFGESGGFGREGRHGEADRYDEESRYGQAGRYDEPDHYGEAVRYDGADPYRYQAPASGDASAQLFGQITIYTLIEERSGDFDRLTERIVAQVKKREPDTLAYIVHAVPTAPMQRILYEVYRDRLAYDDHLRQPYIARYEVERRPFVLATNVIELGLQQAKVSAFPSFSTISDILSESGIDLTGVTRSSRGGGPASHAGPVQPGASPPAPSASPQGEPWPEPRPEPRPEPMPGDRGYQNPYQGWDEIRGEDQRRR